MNIESDSEEADLDSSQPWWEMLFICQVDLSICSWWKEMRWERKEREGMQSGNNTN